MLLEAQNNPGDFADPIGEERVVALHEFVSLSRSMAFSVPLSVRDETAERVKQRVLEQSAAVEELLTCPNVTRAAANFVGRHFFSDLAPLRHWVGNQFDDRTRALRERLDPFLIA
jgi:hypothetical protein